MDILITINFTANTIETQFKYVLPSSAMDETSAFVSDHLISLKNPEHMITG